MAKPTPVAAAEEAAALRRRLRRLVAAVTAGGAEGDAFDEAQSALAALRAAELGRQKDAARGGNRSASVPEQFLCPISSEIMRDPVVLASGQVISNPRPAVSVNSGPIQRRPSVVNIGSSFGLGLLIRSLFIFCEILIRSFAVQKLAMSSGAR